ncbi:MAG: putative Ig domain-containing protein [Blastocatellia bacterium]|nr:putative Ig domain-containing protein [Blastocatellia bacterium]
MFCNLNKAVICLILLTLGGMLLFSGSSRLVSHADHSKSVSGFAPVIQSEPEPATQATDGKRDTIALWQLRLVHHPEPIVQVVSPGIELAVNGDQSHLVARWTVAPGAEATSIPLDFPNMERVEPLTERDWMVHTSRGKIHIFDLSITQTVNSIRQEIPGGLELKARNQVGFWLGEHTLDQPVVISAKIFAPALVQVLTGGGISIPTLGAGNPYPSGLVVPGGSGIVTDVNVQLNDLSHTSIRDISIILESPGGIRVNIFNRRGPDAPFTGTLAFDDQSPNPPLQALVPFGTGTYQPSGSSITDPFPGLGSGPWSTSLAAFNGSVADGQWNLYIIDPLANDGGSMASWNLVVTTGFAPAFTPAGAIARQQGSPAGAAVVVGTVSDPDTAAGSLSVAQIAGGTATGITVTGLANSNGTVTAQVAAGCTATSGTVRFQVSDGTFTGTGSLQVNVSANTAPSIAYTTQSVTQGGSRTINPSSGPTDNGSIASVAITSQGTYTGTISINSATGVISVSNAAPFGTHTIATRVTDNCGATNTASFSLNVTCPTLAVNPATLPNGTAGTGYNQTLTGSGGTSPYTLGVTAGALPTGLSLGSAGALSGTPTTTGTFNFTVTATDNNGCTGSRAYTVIIGCPTITVNPATLPNGAFGMAYSQNVTSGGGNGAVTFDVSVGTLPTGLTLGSTGALTGTPTVAGSFSFTVRATDSTLGTPCTGTRSYTVVIACPTITVSPASPLPAGTVGTAYNQTFTASGGSGTFGFGVTAGTLPTGMTLSGTGLLSGTPTVNGTFNFTVTATDTTPTVPAGGCPGSQSYALTINCAGISVNPATLPGGTVGTAYNQTVTGSGGTSSYSFAMTGGTLPTGLSLSAAGVLSGTPTTTGSFSFTITTTDSTTPTACTGSRGYTVAISCPTISVNPATLPNGTAGTGYSQNLSGSGGTSPYSFAVTSGALPTGLALAPGGTLSGTPTATGTFNFTVTATDSTPSNPPGTNCTGTRTYSIQVVCGTITVSPTSLPTATAGTAYSQNLTGSGGVSAYGFAVTTGSLPPGLTLAPSGTLSGTPSQAGAFNFTVTATDSATPAGCTGSRAYIFQVNCPTVAVTGTLSGGTAGTAYSSSVSATPAGGGYSFAVTAGSLPPGVSLASNGMLAGTPSQAGTFNFTVTATGFGTCTGSQPFTVTIACPTVTVSPTNLPDTNQGEAYSQMVSASPNGGNYNFAVTAGALPPGLSLNSSTGVISGAATATGTYPFTITATGFGTCTGSQSYSVRVICPIITTGPGSLTTGTAGVAYSGTLTATGGQTPYTFTVQSGGLPTGVTLSPNGTLSGTPLVVGTFNFTVMTRDANNCPGTGSYSLQVVCPVITVSPANPPFALAGVAYMQNFTQANGVGAISFQATGNIPPGLSLATNGTLAGTPTTAGSYSFTVTATDANNCTGSQIVTLIVRARPTITAGTPLTRQQGSAGTVSLIATVNDVETPAGNLLVTPTVVPAGLMVTGIVNSNGSVTATVIAGCAATVGANTVLLTVTDGDGLTTTANLTVNVTANSAPQVGGYPAQNVVAGNPLVITPSAPPSDNGTVASVTVSASSGYAGTLTVNSVTGIVSANPVNSGTFIITVTVTDNCGASTSQAFQLVTQPFQKAPIIQSLSPTSGMTGTSVVISGFNLDHIATVQFGGVNASFTIDSANQITAIVPAQALTGPVLVAGTTGTATGPVFTVIRTK